MPTPIAVVFIHGINVAREGYHENMQRRLLKALPRRLHDFVTFRAVFWADIVRGRQKEYLDSAVANSGMQLTQMHRLVVEGLGDAAAYQKTRDFRNSAYYQIQERVRDTFSKLDSAELARRPLVIVGHSLGCHIASSYAWDLHKIKQLGEDAPGLDAPTREFVRWARDATPFMRLDTFTGFVTMGSNMPLFTFTFGPHNVFPITRTNDPHLKPAFPGAELPPVFREKARWLNFFSHGDPLGYPLKPLNEAYRTETRLHDIPVRSEGALRARLPRRLRPLNALAAHTGYWRTPAVVSQTATYLQSLIEA